MTSEDIGALSAVLQTVLVAVGLFYAGFQLREASSARKSEVALYVFDRINAPDSAANRHALYGRAAAGTVGSSDEALAVINDFHLLGYMMRSGMINDRLVLEMYYGTIARVWLCTAHLIADERVRRGSLYAEHLEWLWLQTKAFIDREKPRMEIRVHGTTLRYPPPRILPK